MKGDAGMYEHISCPICKGFLIDTITLTRCAHFCEFWLLFFAKLINIIVHSSLIYKVQKVIINGISVCRSCLLRHLQQKKNCPTCHEELIDLQSAFHPDHTLQDFVYKYAPSTYWKEIRQRADFIEKRFPTPQEKRLIADLNLTQFSQFLCHRSEKISLCLEYISPKEALQSSLIGFISSEKVLFRRYFRCSAEVKMKHLRSLLQGKFDLPDNYVLQFIHLNSEEILEDEYSLQDLVYIFGWQRNEPLKISFTLTQIVSEEETPPILEVEESMGHEEASNDLPPELDPEPIEKMPSLTVNLSSALFQPDSSSMSNLPRVPIITKTTEQPPKKRRKTIPKKTKLVQLLTKPSPETPSMNPTVGQVLQQSNTPTLSPTVALPNSPCCLSPLSSSQSPKNGSHEPQKVSGTPDSSSSSSHFKLMNPAILTMQINNSLSSAVAPMNSVSVTEPATPVSADIADSIKLEESAQEKNDEIKERNAIFQEVMTALTQSQKDVETFTPKIEIPTT